MNKTGNPLSPRWVKLSGLALLGLLLIWLPIEDLDEGLVLAFAAAISAWGGIRYLLDVQNRPDTTWLRYILVGGFAGLAITPTTLILMAIKTGLHGHESPDFTPHQMARVVELTPLWLGVGLLIGIGAGLWRTAKSK
jgi:hypothetical protein